jgi:hypothetical protein
MRVKAYSKLHGGQLATNISGVLTDGRPQHLGIGTSLERLLGQVVVKDEVTKHPNSLVEWAVLIVAGETVLLEEVITEETSNLKSNLIRLSERVLTDELDDFGKIFFLLKNLVGTSTKGDELGVKVLIEGLEGLQVTGVGQKPVDGGEMLTLGKTLLKTPENLNNVKGLRSNGLGEITTRGGDGTDNGDGTNTLGASDAANLTGTLVEGSKTSSQVSRVTGLGWHLCETTRNFTKSLGPTGGRVGHHSNVESLITEVLREGNTGVDRSLTSSDRHVGSVSDEGSTSHNRLLLAVDGHSKLRELHKYFSHLVTALTATDVDNDVRVGVLGQGLRNDSLTATEGTGNSSGTTLDAREQGIENTLTSEERVVRSKLLGARTRSSDGPNLHHGVVGLLAVEFDSDDGVLKGVVTLRSEPGDLTHSLRGKHNLLCDKGVFDNGTNDVTTSNLLTNLFFSKQYRTNEASQKSASTCTLQTR